ncbi:hypothetical protein IWX90DRAFT_100283 [Phyllosticta citrichinensis]|uniref:Uncharacterized protein n=1 Tax=Phyllosticta citrichinensis TaxID=1130410 RepID=A0ABR1Y260_9PEZI
MAARRPWFHHDDGARALQLLPRARGAAAAAERHHHHHDAWAVLMKCHKKTTTLNKRCWLRGSGPANESYHFRSWCRGSRPGLRQRRESSVGSGAKACGTMVAYFGFRRKNKQRRSTCERRRERARGKDEPLLEAAKGVVRRADHPGNSRGHGQEIRQICPPSWPPSIRPRPPLYSPDPWLLLRVRPFVMALALLSGVSLCAVSGRMDSNHQRQCTTSTQA